MSNRAMSWAVEIKTLPLTTKAVLMLLADCHNGSTGQCNPSMIWLQERTGLKPRALQLHFKLLEEGGFMERTYVHHGRAKGCTVDQFTLKIGIMAAKNAPPKEVIDTQENAGVKNCARKKLPMRAQNIAHSYKEEPEENRKSNVDFEDAWVLYKSAPLKAGQTKKLAKAAWSKAVERAGSPERILTAIRADVDARTNPEGFIAPLPDMHRWLKNERWEDAERETQPEPVAELPVDAWREAMRKFVDHGTWPAFLGPKPGEEGCRVPEGLLNHWKRIAA